MNQSNVGSLKKKLIDAGMGAEDTIRGCNSLEISSLEELTGCRLPDAYRAFLAVFGHSAR